VNKTPQKRIARRKRRIKRRLEKGRCENQANPMFAASNIHYEVADRMGGVASGGIGAAHKLAQQTAIRPNIALKVRLFKD